MTKINQQDIHIISRHSNWSKTSISKALKDYTYSNPKSWRKFLQLFFISLGIGFTASGVVFFFAYNWADLHKFVKLGLIEGLIVITTFAVVFSKLNVTVKNIILTGASILVGALFAVFGQIYQTGANAYDFFLGWTVFITLWVFISNFPPLWLTFITLINTTFILYVEQVAFYWSETALFASLFLINSVVLISFLYAPKVWNTIRSPGWFTNIISLAAIACSTLGISVGIHEDINILLLFFVVGAVLAYSISMRHGFNTRNAFYLAVIPFSVIIIISSFLVKISDDAGMFFFISLFVAASITLVIRSLINLQKKWRNE